MRSVRSLQGYQRSSRRTIGAAIATAALLWSAVTYGAGAWDSSPLNSAVLASHHRCGSTDLPETGIQGAVPKADQQSGRAKKGYNCGLALAGYTALAKTADGKDSRPNANANMAWAGRCAYVSGGAGNLFNPPVISKPPKATPAGPGVAVVDVHDPAHPRMVRILRQPGAVATVETLGAMTKPDGTGILVVGQYGNDPVSDPKPMDIYVYDTRDPNCADLFHVPNPTNPALATYYWPKNIHNLTITPDGRYVYATLPVEAIDISGLWGHLSDPKVARRIRYVGELNADITGAPVGIGPQNDLIPASAYPAPPLVADDSHEAWATDDRMLYIGGQTPSGEIFTILDVSRWLAGTGPAKVLSEDAGRGHSIRTATIGGHKYLLHSEESVFGTAYGCVPQIANPFVGPAQPWLTNIDDPRHPYLVSQMGLQINQAQNCSTQLSDGENDSVHYHDVDDPNATHFVMASMWNAGLRVFDVRNPKQPTEVAYFNPADIAPKGQPPQLDHLWGHVHYDAANGEIWFASAYGGFYVVRLESQLRNALGLPAVSPVAQASARDVGRPGTIGVAYQAPLGGHIDITPYYCTLGVARGQLSG